MLAHQLQLTIADIVAEAHNVHHPVASGLYYRDQKPEAAARRRGVSRGAHAQISRLFRARARRAAGRGCSARAGPMPDLSLFQLVEGLAYAFPEADGDARRPTSRCSPRFRDRVRELPELADYLASDRRLPFNEDGLFRHYPELDGA